MKEKSLVLTVCALGLMVLNTTLPAATETIVWGDLVGQTVKYNGLYETSDTDTLDINGDSILDSGPASLDGLYGSPRLDGDSLAFDDLDFLSYSNGSGSDITRGVLGGQIEGKPNFYVNQIYFSEFGDVTTNAFAPGGVIGTASITNSIDISILEVDGVGLATPIDFTANMVVNPQSSWSTSVTGGTWSGSLLVDVTAAVRAAGYADGFATLVNFELSNTLETSAANGGSGYIAKKETGGLYVETFNQENGIPEPATLVLLGLGGLLLRKRR